MFDAQRTGKAQLYLNDDPELVKGLYFYELARRLAKHRFDRWVEWLAIPDTNSNQQDDQFGNRLFLAALGWIMRHELAHIALQHHVRIRDRTIDSHAAEIEADTQACNWVKANLRADHQRPEGQRPGNEEIELERRALTAATGLLWVGLFEEAFYSASPGHPAIAERIFAAFNVFDVGEDSFASEIFSYSVKAWIDPQGDWGVPTNKEDATAKSAFAAAVVRLHRHMTDL